MSIHLHGRDFLAIQDFSREEIDYLLDLSKELKVKKKSGYIGQSLHGKNIVLLFEKTSTRTRCSFEIAVYDEGGHITFLDMKDSQIGKKESIEDSAKVLSRLYDGIEFRGHSHKTVEDLAKYSEVPVWNGLTNMYHPTQVLADYLTIAEHVNKPYKDINFVFVGDLQNNMGHSLICMAAKMGVRFVGIAPRELHPSQEYIDNFDDLCKEYESEIIITEDIEEGVKGADVIYTDVWVSMGDEDKAVEKTTLLSPYKVTQAMFDATGNKNTIFLHCLPSFHNFETDFAKSMKEQGLDVREVEDEVFRADYSKVFDQAENRLHSIKAVIVATIGRR